MKSDKEFIEEVYKKYEFYKKDNANQVEKNKGKLIIARFTAVAATVLIVFLFVSGQGIFYKDVLDTEELENEPIETEKISLATVDNFENLYNLVKESNINETSKSGLNSEAMLEDITNVSKSAETKEEANYSTTNIQEENVDEADIVKTDGKYIYMVSQAKIVIVDIRNNNMVLSSKVEFQNNDFIPRELYINGDKLIVFGDSNASIMTKTMSIYDVAVMDDQMKSTMIIYDITDRTSPQEIRKIQVEGYYTSSRMIGDNVYFVTNRTLYTSKMLKYTYEEINEDDYKPKYEDSIMEEEEKIDFKDIYYFNYIENPSYLILAGINLNDVKEADIKTFLGAGDNVYCSDKNMYIVKTGETINPETKEVGDSYTKILKFNLKNGKINFKAETEISGYVNNQFSMSESDEYFRIATTSGKQWNLTDETTNTLYILDEKLHEVAHLGDLAKGERIYSVRYMEDKAYIVTFKQVDPLFVIDLSNPTQPQVLGELKIPGYSTYLHPYDETHLIGIGYDTTESASITGIKMAMFDISDYSNPKELFKVNIGDKYTSSEVLYNHKALLYLKDKDLIALPVNMYYKKPEYKALIYKIDLTQGFVLQDEILHEYSNTGDSSIRRIVYANDDFYAISNSQIKSLNTRKFIKNNLRAKTSSTLYC